MVQKPLEPVKNPAVSLLTENSNGYFITTHAIDRLFLLITKNP